MNNKDNKLIYEAYAEELNRGTWNAPEGGFASAGQATAGIAEMPQELHAFFKTDTEEGLAKTFHVIVGNDRFYDQAQAIDGDGMGGVTEYQLGKYTIGMEDGNYAVYIR